MNSEPHADEPLAPLNDRFKFFLANMDFNTTPIQIKSFFSSFGIVNYVKIIMKKTHPNTTTAATTTTSRSKGYGFLYMLDESGDAAVEKFAKENRHRIVLMGKDRVFLSRHDDSRAQPIRNPMRALMDQKTDWNIVQVAPNVTPSQKMIGLPSNSFPPPSYQGWNHQDPTHPPSTVSASSQLPINVVSQNLGAHLMDRSPKFSNGQPLFPLPPQIQTPSDSYAPNTLYSASAESSSSISHPHTSHIFSISSAPPSVAYGSNFQESPHNLPLNLSGIPTDFSLTHQPVSDFYSTPSHISNVGFSNNSLPNTNVHYSNGGYSNAQAHIPQTYAHPLSSMPIVQQNVAATSFSSYAHQGGPGPNMPYFDQNTFDGSNSQMYNTSGMHLGTTSLSRPPHTNFHSSSSFLGRGNRGRGGRNVGRGRGGGGGGGGGGVGGRDTRHRNRDRPY
jgi:hypothetical protein